MSTDDPTSPPPEEPDAPASSAPPPTPAAADSSEVTSAPPPAPAAADSPEVSSAPPPAPAAADSPEVTSAPPPAPAAADQPLGADSPASERPWTRMAWDAGLILALVLLVWLAAQVKGFTVPFIIAFIIAYLLDPLVDRFENAGVSRTLAIGILLGLFLIAGGLALVILGPQVAREFALIPAKVQLFLVQAQPWIEQTLGTSLPANIQGMFDTLMAELSSDQAAALLKPAGTIVQTIFGGTTSAVSALVALLLIPVFAFFLLRDFDVIVADVGELIPARYRTFIGARVKEIDETLSRFVRGQLSVAGILVLLYSVGLWIVGLPLAMVIAVVAGVGNLIPYLGTTLGVLLAAIMLMLDWQGWGHVGSVALVFGIVQVLEGWVITPRIVGDSVGLSTLAVIIAVMVFGELFGFYGVLVAVPAAAILKILVREGLDAYRASRFFREA
ncbi:MAG: AI-2E family transporter [Myxococcota bacterium]